MTLGEVVPDLWLVLAGAAALLFGCAMLSWRCGRARQEPEDPSRPPKWPRGFDRW